MGKVKNCTNLIFTWLLLCICIIFGVTMDTKAATTISLGDNITCTLDGDGGAVITGTGLMYDYNMYKSPLYTYRDVIEGVTINEGVNNIGKYVFAGLTELRGVGIPSTVTTIGKGAFIGCEDFFSLDFTSNSQLTSIGADAFNGCTSLTDFGQIPKTVRSFGTGSFSKTRINHVYLDDYSITSVPDHMFNCCMNLQSVTLPNDLQSIGYCAFYSCHELYSVVPKNSFTSNITIGSYAFEDCYNLQSPDKLLYVVSTIGNGTFSGCTDNFFDELTFGPNLTKIGANAFRNCYNVKTITNSSNSASIATDAFDFEKNSKRSESGDIIKNYYHYKYKADNGSNFDIDTGNIYSIKSGTTKIYLYPTITVADWTYGSTPSDVVFEESSGDETITYEYSGYQNSVGNYMSVAPANIKSDAFKGLDGLVSTSSGVQFQGKKYANSTTKPTEAGRYQVTVTIGNSHRYCKTTLTKYFTIKRASISPSVTMSNWTYGSTASNPSVSGNIGNGTVAYSYKGTENGGTTNGYNSTTKPSNAGSYTVTATIPQTNNYTSGSCSKTFKINKADMSPSVTISDFTYGSACSFGSTPPIAGNTGNGTVTYMYTGTVNGGNSNGYNSSTIPKQAGTYKVTATIAATNNYNGATCSDTFTIKRANIESARIYTCNDKQINVTAFDYGDTFSTELYVSAVHHTVPYDEVPYQDISTYTYTGTENGGTTNGYNSTIKPSNAGSYTLTVTIPQTNNYNGGSCSTTFVINRARISPSLSMNSWTYGGTASNSSVSGNSGNGVVTYTYTGTVNGGTSNGYNSTTKPSNAGSYTVTATISQTNNYNSGTCSKTFTINRANISPSVNISNWTYGNTASSPSVSGNSGSGTITYNYIGTVNGGTNNGYNSTTKPSNAGSYKVTATVAQTNNYNSGSCNKTFTINRANISPSVSISNWTYGGTASNPSVSGNSGSGTITYAYSGTVNGGTNYASSATKPTNAGSYKVTASVAQTNNYNSNTCEKSFTINRANISPSVAMSDWTYGSTASNPSVSGNTGNGATTYTYTGTVNGGTNYNSSTKPSNAGSYKVKASIGQTNNYNSGTCEKTFVINRANITPSVSKADYTYNTTPTQPVVTGNAGNGTVSYQYKENSADTFTDTEPTDAGNYTIKASLAQTNNYNAGTCEDAFTINKANITPAVSLSDWTYKTPAAQPSVDGNTGEGDVVYTYKKANADDDTYTEVQPKKAGLYTVRATVPATKNYLGGTATSNFEIERENLDLSVSMDDFTYGQTPSSPIVVGNLGGGQPTFTYKAQGSNSFTSEKPVTVGTHTVKVVIPETANYFGGEASSTYTVTKANLNLGIYLPNFVYGSNPPSPFAMGNIAGGEETITYKVTGENDSTYTNEMPTAVGNYTIRYQVDATDNYNAGIATNTFKITKGAIHPTVSIENWIYGETANEPVVRGNTDNAGVTYQYKIRDAEDDTYTNTKPTNAGAYTIKAIVSASDNYNGAECTADFRITKAALNPTLVMSDTHYGVALAPSVVNNAGNGEVTYMYRDWDSDVYSFNAPTELGHYTVKAVIAESANYYGTSVTKGFKIIKGIMPLAVVISDWTYGEVAPNPIISGNIAGGKEKIEYKLASDNDDAYTTLRPSLAGEYNIRYSVEETANYNADSVENTFTIHKATLNPTFTFDDFVYNTTPSEPVITGNIENGDITYTYKLKDTDDAFISTMPVNAGTYIAKAVIGETANYNSKAITTEFNITKADITPQITVEDVIYGNAIAPVLAGNISEGTETIEYKLTSEDDDAYTENIPTDAGEYMVRYTVASTANYNGGVATDTFTINKAEISPEITKADDVYGRSQITPVITGNPGDGEIIYTYKVKDSDEDFSEDVPTEIGAYVIKATIAETKNYLGNVCYADYNIVKEDLALTVSMEDFTYGENASEPTVSGNIGNGSEIIEYKLSSAGDDAYTESVPTDAGEYTVRYTVVETANYNGGVATDTFTVNKADLDAAIEIEDWTYQEEASTPTVTGNMSEGTETIEYKLTSAEDETYTSEVPSEIGEYTIRLTIGETDNYNGKIVTNTFKIKRVGNNITVSMEDFTYGETPSEPEVSGNATDNPAIITYKLVSADDSEYTEIMPTNAGEYNIKAYVSGNELYDDQTVVETFTINKADLDINVSLEDWELGESANTPVITGNVGGGNEIITYKALRAPDTAYSEDVPSMAGNYIIKLTVEETDNYNSKTVTNKFKINGEDYDIEVSMDDFTYGEEPATPTITGNISDGEELFMYKAVSADDDAYTEDIPTDAGEYNIKGIVTANNNYNEISSVNTFTIHKADINPELTMEDFTYGETASNPVITGCNAVPEYTYKAQDSEDYGTDKIVTAGTHTVKAVIAETDNYNGKTVSATYTVHKAEIEPAISIADWSYLEEASEPIIAGNTGNGNYTVLYKLQSEDDNAYVETIPTAVGKYDAKVVIDESDNYQGGTATCTFEIKNVTVNSPKITIDDDYKVTITAGTIDNDILDSIYYRINNGEWVKYTDSFEVFGDFVVEAKQVAARTKQESDIATQEGTEAPTGITATYLGKAKAINDVISNDDVKVVVHYPNSEDKEIHDFTMDNNAITSAGDNTITVTYEKYTATITVEGIRVFTNLNGVITYADDKPFANKDITLINKTSKEEVTVKTDDNGRYIFETLSADNYSLMIVENEIPLFNEDIIIEEITAEDINKNIKLNANQHTVMKGNLSYEAPFQITSATISLLNTSTNKKFETVSDSDGSFVIKDITLGNYEIDITFDGMNIYHGTFKVDDKASLNEITFDKVITINKTSNVTGKVTFANDLPAANITVVIDSIETQTNSNGEYSINDVLIGKHQIQVTNDSNILHKGELNIDTKSDDIITYNIKLDVDASTKAPTLQLTEDYKVKITAGDILYDNLKDIYYQVNDGEWIKYNEPFPIYKTCDVNAYQITDNGLKSETVTFNAIEPVVSISAIYKGTDKFAGETVDKEDIEVALNYPNSESEITTDFKISDNNILAGDNNIEIIYGDLSTHINITGLNTTADINGICKDSNDDIVTDKVLRLVKKDEKVDETVTDESGKFIFKNIGVGEYTINLYTTGNDTEELIDSKDITIDAEYIKHPNIITFTLEAPKKTDISGNLVSEDDTPIKNATITLIDTTTNKTYETTTDEDGNYEISELPEGVYTIVVTDSDKKVLYEKELVVEKSSDEDNKQIISDIEIPVSKKTDISGNLVSEDDMSIKNATITLIDTTTNKTYETTTDENGNYEISDLPEGVYTIVVTDSDEKVLYEKELVIEKSSSEDGKQIISDIEIPVSKKTDISGNLVSEDDTPIKNATIRLIDTTTNKTYETTTDEHGNYEISELPEGVYTIVVTDSDEKVLYEKELVIEKSSSEDGKQIISDIEIPTTDINDDVPQTPDADDKEEQNNEDESNSNSDNVLENTETVDDPKTEEEKNIINNNSLAETDLIKNYTPQINELSTKLEIKDYKPKINKVSATKKRKIVIEGKTIPKALQSQVADKKLKIQYQVSKNKKMQNAKTYSSSKTKYTTKRQSKGTYYVRIRIRIIRNDNKIYSKWSKVKKVVVK